jgi:cytochrome c
MRSGIFHRCFIGLFAAAIGASAAAAQDATAGQRAFVVCRACHQIGPNAKSAVGPALNGVVGRKAGTYAGFNYSDANRDSGLTWDPATLERYLAKPQEVVPNTKMTFAGISDQQKVKDIIAFLSQFGPDGQKTP